MDVFQGIGDRIDYRTSARAEYEARVASKETILDIGGRNQQSVSNQRLRSLCRDPASVIVSTDIIPDYNPDLVDDICSSRIESESFSGIYCEAVLEHVKDYQAAVRHIYRILKPGGEVFIYVPFFFCFHDEMDYHRFTFTEIDRILGIFSQHKVMLSDGNGFGGVLWQLVTFYNIQRYPRLWRVLSRCTNAILGIFLTLKFKSKRDRSISLREYRFYYTHLYINHGFCGWAVK